MTLHLSKKSCTHLRNMIQGDIIIWPQSRNISTISNITYMEFQAINHPDYLRQLKFQEFLLLLHVFSTIISTKTTISSNVIGSFSTLLFLNQTVSDNKMVLSDICCQPLLNKPTTIWVHRATSRIFWAGGQCWYSFSYFWEGQRWHL